MPLIAMMVNTKASIRQEVRNQLMFKRGEGWVLWLQSYV